MTDTPLDYATAGVDTAAGDRAVELMKSAVAATHDSTVLGATGGFAGMVDASALLGMEKPLLATSTDGVGTKIAIAQAMDVHDTIGQDLVGMVVDDIVVIGARPVLMTDYIACGHVVPERIASIVTGIARACEATGTPLIGGETAEPPGMMAPEDYDLAGFAVGVVDRSRILDKNTVQPGDVMLALPSTGVHSNGFSLVRRVFDVEHADLDKPLAALDGASLGQTLLTPTRIYVRAVRAALAQGKVKAISHITGGGFYENIPRSLPAHCGVCVDKASLRIPPIFDLIAKTGDIPERDMFNTFNMGVGMCLTVAAEDVPPVLDALRQAGEDAYVMGQIVSGSGVSFR